MLGAMTLRVGVANKGSLGIERVGISFKSSCCLTYWPLVFTYFSYPVAQMKVPLSQHTVIIYPNLRIKCWLTTQPGLMSIKNGDIIVSP